MARTTTHRALLFIVGSVLYNICIIIIARPPRKIGQNCIHTHCTRPLCPTLIMIACAQCPVVTPSPQYTPIHHPNVNLIFPLAQTLLRRHRHCRCRRRVLRSTLTLRSSLYAFSGQDPRTVFHDARLPHRCIATTVYSWHNVVTVLIEREGLRLPI